MELAQWQDRIEYVSAGYADHYGVDRTTEWVLLKLTEEVGELVQAHLSSSGQGRDRGRSPEELAEAVRGEVADVLAMTLVAAQRLGVDVEEALAEKWLRYESFHQERGFVAGGAPAAG
ncbi:phosphoribosyl-ATP pyrophosphohydrolase [Arsenicicoccus dermatophilus]|uniref:phosphoribosyl-ATP pyrophosphohydrolase n=1 Tax=Arsenicicoccus dermatophilus TaxID=1076331 RepID=UPI0039172F0F